MIHDTGVNKWRYCTFLPLLQALFVVTEHVATVRVLRQYMSRVEVT